MRRMAVATSADIARLGRRISAMAALIAQLWADIDKLRIDVAKGHRFKGWRVRWNRGSHETEIFRSHTEALTFTRNILTGDAKIMRVYRKDRP